MRRRQDLLTERRRQAMRLAGGSPLDFPPVTSAVRADPSWRVAPPAPGLTDRRVEITGPPNRRMTVDVRTCHKRRAHAIGGMAAHVPSKEPAAHAAALATVRLDKEREAEDGFDGSRVAHPGLVPLCREVFDGVLVLALFERNALDRELPPFFTPDAYATHLVRGTEPRS